MTFEDVAVQALLKNRILGEDQPTLSAVMGAAALAEGNALLEEFNIRSILIYATTILQFNLTARTLPTYWFTIGPSGADFTAARPTKIIRANLVLTGSTPNVRVPLDVIEDIQWSDVPQPALGVSAYPTRLYNGKEFPNSKLYLHPYPTTSANALELFVPYQIPAWAAVSDTFAFPPGFYNAYMLTLSERLCEGYGAVPDSLAKSAAKARAYFAATNGPSMKISTTDSGIPGSRRSNGTVYTGWSR